MKYTIANDAIFSVVAAISTILLRLFLSTVLAPPRVSPLESSPDIRGGSRIRNLSSPLVAQVWKNISSTFFFFWSGLYGIIQVPPFFGEGSGLELNSQTFCLDTIRHQHIKMDRFQLYRYSRLVQCSSVQLRREQCSAIQVRSVQVSFSLVQFKRVDLLLY